MMEINCKLNKNVSNQTNLSRPRFGFSKLQLDNIIIISSHSEGRAIIYSFANINLNEKLCEINCKTCVVSVSLAFRFEWFTCATFSEVSFLSWDKNENFIFGLCSPINKHSILRCGHQISMLWVLLLYKF